MKLIAFSKHFKEKSLSELIAIAHETGLDGWDLCVRPGYPVHPDNAHTALPDVVRQFAAEGVAIPMVTGNFDLVAIDHPTAVPILSAMDKAGVRFLKLGYYGFNPLKQDYWQEVSRIRRLWEGWQDLARRYSVRVCYHTHSDHCMGMDGGMLAHLLQGFDPQYIGAYLDPAHILVEGEEFPVALSIVKDYLSLVALKDVIMNRVEVNGHGKRSVNWLAAGKGMVDWTSVFTELVRVKYDGPMSVHCEFVAPNDPQFMASIRQEIAFFRQITSRFWPLGGNDAAAGGAGAPS